MRKAIFTLLLAVSLPAFGEWKLIDTNKDGDRVYYDPSTLERTGNLVRIWELSDLHALNQVGRLSYRTLMEFDCPAHRLQLIRSESYVTHMASGKVVDTNDYEPAEWQGFNPGSLYEKTYKAVCTK